MTSQITYIQIDIYDGVKKRAIPRAKKSGFLKVLNNHRNVTLGKHFKNVSETQPGGAYGYAKRDPKYTQMKQKRYGHTLPNVATGRMRNGIRNNSIPRATKDKGTLQIKAPARKTGRSDRNFSMTEQQRDEITAVSDQEWNDMGDMMRLHVSTELSKPENKLKRKKRV